MATAIGAGSALEQADVSSASLWARGQAAPLLARMRREDPVHFCAASAFGPYWSVTRHSDIVCVETQPGLFSSSWQYGGITLFGDSAAPAEERLPMFIAMDPPEHDAPRAAVAPALAPGAVGTLAPAVRARTAALIDMLPVGEPFDWVDRVSIELTTQMLAILFDFPWDERRLLTHWSDWAADIEAARDPQLRLQRMRILWECGRYFLRLRRVRGTQAAGSNLLSRLVRSERLAGMTPRQFLGNLVVLIIGGNDTTRNTISALALVNQRFPDEWDRLRADPSLIDNAVQELIRWQTPLAHMRRTATSDAELGGKNIRAGDKVVLWYLSANRDEAVFPDGDRFDAGRANARRHLAFGAGIHRCVGARLAQLQLATLIETLLERGLKPVAAGEPDRVASSFVHGFRRLPVRLERVR